MSGYQPYGQLPPDPRQPQSTFRPPVAPNSTAYQQTNSAPHQFQNAPQPQNPYQGYGAPSQEQGYLPPAQQLPQSDMGTLGAQMGNMGLENDVGGTRTQRKKHRHAYHSLERPDSASAGGPGLPQAPSMFGGQLAGPGGQQWAQQQYSTGSQQMLGPATVGGFAPPTQPQQLQQLGTQVSAPLTGTPASSTQGRVDPEQIPSVPWSRDGPAQYYLQHVYPTMELHLPPPASIPFVAVDQGNSSPKFARLTLNNIPVSSDTLAITGLPLGLILQPLATLQDGELPVPVVDFGEAGPPRCRRCRAYINPFMTFRSGGNKFVCNMCTFPNDTAAEYFAPTDPSGVRVDRTQRPELLYGTCEFTAPKEYWTKEPVPLRWLFLIDASMESVSKGFIHGVCEGILRALYGDSEAEPNADGEPNGVVKSMLPPGARVGIAAFDKAVQFFNIDPSLDRAQMIVMPDLEDPFVPLAGGLFVDPIESKAVITNLLNEIPNMFSQIKSPEPALLPTLSAAVDALKATGGKILCSLGALPTWGPGRLILREKPEMRDTEAEKKLFTTEHPGYTKLARQMTEAGVGVDFFLAAPQGGYLDIATVGHLAEKTGGETYYYPNFHSPRDVRRLSQEIARTLTRATGFQGLLKVRCSNGLQVSGYFGNFSQATPTSDVEFGAVDADKALAVTFSYDGKLDPKLDAHFQAALLYTTASGARRIRCTNTVASVSESAMDAMRLVDQDAVVTVLAKQAAARVPDRMLKEVRATLTEKTIDILSAYRRNFSGSHPPGQLVLPENLKEFAMYTLGLLKSRALKAGAEPTDRRIAELRALKGMTPLETSLYLYPRVLALHSLEEGDGFPNEQGHLRVPAAIRASYARIDDGGAYLVDNGQSILLWLHANVSPNLLEDLFGPDHTSLHTLDASLSALPVLETHLNAQARNILQWLADARGSRAPALQLARQGLDGAEYEFARLLVEDRNNEAQSYVDWLVHLHRQIQAELQGSRKKEEGEGGGVMGSITGFIGGKKE